LAVGIMPGRLARRIPVVGSFHIALPSGNKLSLSSDGKDLIATRLYWGGWQGYEGETLQLFLKLVPAAGTVLDIGAHTGIYSLMAAIEDPTRRVYAFEPVPMISQYLHRAIELNGLTNIHVDSSAVTNFDGKVELFIPPPQTTLPTDASTRPDWRQTGATIVAPATTLDSFVKRHGIPRVDFLKIDTEATEHLVLAGASQTLSRDLPVMICEVLKGETESELHNLLDPLAYRYFWISGTGLVEKPTIEGDPTYSFMNYLMITGRRMQELEDLGIVLK